MKTDFDQCNIGDKYLAKCNADYDYEGKLREGNYYIITIIPSILPMRKLCEFIDDTGQKCQAHLNRFLKIIAL